MFIISIAGVRKALVVQLVYEEFEDFWFRVIELDDLVFGLFEVAGESGAEVFGVVREELFVHNEAFLSFANENSGERWCGRAVNRQLGLRKKQRVELTKCVDGAAGSLRLGRTFHYSLSL
jgi:hypothetical protein